MKRLLIVDGSNLLFQMFFGMPSRIVGRNGRAIQGTLGFVGALIKIIKITSPTHAIVVFDGESHNPRTDLDPEYKANRPDYSEVGEDENPFSQLPDIYAALDVMGVRRYETVAEEADDLISAYCHGREEGLEIIISSFDSDFFQLISDGVRVLRYRGDKSVICDTGYVLEHLGVPPSAYADYKSLVGDHADNIRGVTGVGPKTAAALISEFGDLDSLIERAGEIKRPKLREAIISECERIRKNSALIRLGCVCDLPFSLSELEYSYGGITTREVLDAIGL